MAIHKEFWRLAWPATAEGLLLMLLTAANLLMVSALGNTAVATVNIFSQPRMVILCVARSYSVTLSAYIARRRGKHPDKSLTSCSRTSFMLGCGLSMLLLVGTWIGTGPLPRLIGVQDDYINLGLQYAFPTLVSLALSDPAIALHGILAGLSDTKGVLVSNVLGSGVNVVFNAPLIYGLDPFPQLGVFGAGLGTVIGADTTLVYTLALSLRRRHPATLWGRGTQLPERKYLCSLAPLATDTFLEQATERFGMFTSSCLVTDLGATALSIHNIYGSLCDIYYSFSRGSGKASLVQVGQALGSGKTCNLKRIGAISRRAALWAGGAATLLHLLLRLPLLQFYHLEGSGLALGCEIMIFIAVIDIPEAQAMVHASLLHGLGHTSFVALYSPISIAVVRPILTFFLVYELGLGLYGVWIALALDQTTRAVCSMLGSRQTIRIKTKDSSNS